MEVTLDAADDRTPATNGKLAAAPVGDEAGATRDRRRAPQTATARAVAAGNLVGRHGAALAPPILLAVGLNVTAVTGLGGIAGFHAVYASLIKIQWPWLGAVPAALGCR